MVGTLPAGRGNGPGSNPPVFAVLGLETTGLSPTAHRVVEIAVVSLDAAGRVTEEFETLVNPEQDVEAVQGNRIAPIDLVRAPTFPQIAGALLVRLAGRVVIGHNIRFDLRFIRNEYARLGVSLPHIEPVCTMHLADTHLEGLHARTLASCCRAAGIPITEAHSALVDARATAALFAAYRRSGRAGRQLWAQAFVAAQRTAWPRVPVTGPVQLLSRAEAVALRAGRRGRASVRSPAQAARLRPQDLAPVPPRPASPEGGGAEAVVLARLPESLSRRRVLFHGLTPTEQQELADVLFALGGETAAYVKSSLACLVSPPERQGDDKVARARRLGVPVVTPAQFRARYGRARPRR